MKRQLQLHWDAMLIQVAKFGLVGQQLRIAALSQMRI
jgi:hypothetical protein